MGYVWKRTLYSLKKRYPERFEQAQLEIAELINQAQVGEIELAYVDEAGFAPQSPNLSAWTKRGEVHAITAKREQRLNVIGALLSSGQLMLAKLWRSVNDLWFFGFLMALIERVSKPLLWKFIDSHPLSVFKIEQKLSFSGAMQVFHDR